MQPEQLQPLQPINRSHFFNNIFLAIAVLLIGVVYIWQHEKVTDLNKQVANLNTAVADQKAQVADREKALTILPNTVLDANNSSTDLIAFLGADNTHCYKDSDNKGYYKVIKEVNARFAKMQYWCEAGKKSSPAGPPAYILANKVNDKWQTISPTNQWATVDGKELPSCKMINDNNVSKLLEPECYVQPEVGIDKFTVQQVTNP